MSKATDLIALTFSLSDYFVGVEERVYQPASLAVKPSSAIEIFVDMRLVKPDMLNTLSELQSTLTDALAHRYEYLNITYRDRRGEHA